MFTKRTDLALEAHELWQESAGKTTRLAGVKATEKKTTGISGHPGGYSGPGGGGRTGKACGQLPHP